MRIKSLIAYGVSLSALFFYTGLTLLPQEKSTEKEMSDEYRVQRKIFQPELTLKGIITPPEMEQVQVNLKEFIGSLAVKNIILSGTIVREGSLLFEADPEPLERLIRDAVHKLESMKSDLERTKSNLKMDEQTGQLELEKAQIRSANAQEQKKSYQELEWPLQKDRDGFTIRQREAYLADQKTELQQLEEMYKESELATKTKEIVLERARRDVELATINLELTRREAEYRRETGHPRQLKNLTNEENWAIKELELLKLRTTLSAAEAKRSLTNLEFEIQKQTEYLQRLQADRELLTVKATKSGIVVHGDMAQRLALRKAPGVPPREEIKPGSTIQQNETILTLYSNSRYCVSTAIPEDFRYLVKSHNTGQVRIMALPDKPLKATVTGIADLADEAHAFSTQLALEEQDTRLRPGLNCLVQFELDKLTDVIVIPAHLIIKREDRTFVNLREGANLVEKEIIIGAWQGDQVWVASGLKEGDILAPKK